MQYLFVYSVAFSLFLLKSDLDLDLVIDLDHCRWSWSFRRDLDLWCNDLDLWSWSKNMWSFTTLDPLFHFLWDILHPHPVLILPWNVCREGRVWHDLVNGSVPSLEGRTRILVVELFGWGTERIWLGLPKVRLAMSFQNEPSPFKTSPDIWLLDGSGDLVNLLFFPTT